MRGPKSALVRVRQPRPHNAVDLTDDRGSFYSLVHQAEAVRRNAPLQGRRTQVVVCWIEVAGHRRFREFTLFGKTVKFSRREPEWERWTEWDRGTLDQLQLPTEEDVERERLLAGALRARVWLETTV